MQGETGRYFERAMDAFGKFKAAKNVSAVDDILGASLKSFGYDKYYFATPCSGAGDTLDRRKLLMNWPAAWREQYERENLVAHDAIAATFRTAKKSFRWSEVVVEGAPARRVMQMAASDHGMTYGFCVPMHGLRGYEAGLSTAGENVDDSDKANFAIELIAIYAFNRFSQVKAGPDVKRLTRREREVLHWIAAGKTTWDVSVILKISEDTVSKIAASAMRRLNTHTRAQAVAEAMRQNEIAF